MKLTIKNILIAGCVAVALMAGCKKANYLSGGSLHDPVTPLNNMEYLKANSLNLFDTTTLIIERLGMATEVNNAKTFFAFTDYSVVNAITSRLATKLVTNPLAAYTLDSLIKDISADSIRQYMFNQTIELETAPELKAQPYTSLGNTNMGVLKQLQIAGPFTDRTKAPTYLLYFVKVRGAVDEPGVVQPPNENDQLIVCQTTGIKTSGVKTQLGSTTLHVLNNGHVFVRFP